MHTKAQREKEYKEKGREVILLSSFSFLINVMAKKQTTDPLELVEEEFRRLEREELSPKKKKKASSEDEDGEDKKYPSESKRGIPSADTSFLTMGREEYLAYLTSRGKPGKRTKEEVEE